MSSPVNSGGDQDLNGNGPSATQDERKRLECVEKRGLYGTSGRRDEGDANFITLASSVSSGGVSTLIVAILCGYKYFMDKESEKNPPNWTKYLSYLVLVLGVAFGVSGLLSATWFANAFGNEDPVRDPTWLKEMRVVRRVQMSVSLLFLLSIVATALAFTANSNSQSNDVLLQVVGVYMLILHLALLAATATLLHYTVKYGKHYYDKDQLVRPSEKSRNWDVCMFPDQDVKCKTLDYWCFPTE